MPLRLHTKFILIAALTPCGALIASPPPEKSHERFSEKEKTEVLETIKSAYQELDKNTEAGNKAAVELFSNLSDKGIPIADTCLGCMYLNGKGVPKNPTIAAIHFKKANQKGETGGTANLALMYDQGIGVIKDRKEAFRLYEIAAAKGNPFAQDQLFGVYLEGESSGYPVKASAVMARKWAKAAAEQGYGEAQAHYGFALMHGIGGDKDEKEAARQYELSANQGTATGMCNLADIYESGKAGYTQNKIEACARYSVAGQLGLKVAEIEARKLSATLGEQSLAAKKREEEILKSLPSRATNIPRPRYNQSIE